MTHVHTHKLRRSSRISTGIIAILASSLIIAVAALCALESATKIMWLCTQEEATSSVIAEILEDVNA
jgi:hypothetical protein